MRKCIHSRMVLCYWYQRHSFSLLGPEDISAVSKVSVEIRRFRFLRCSKPLAREDGLFVLFKKAWCFHLRGPQSQSNFETDSQTGVFDI